MIQTTWKQRIEEICRDIRFWWDDVSVKLFALLVMLAAGTLIYKIIHTEHQVGIIIKHQELLMEQQENK